MIQINEHIKGLIFDCDGTLVDSMPLHLDAWKKAFEFNNREFPFEFIESQKGASANNIVLAYNSEFNDNLDPKKVREDKAKFLGDSLVNVKPIAITVELAKNYFGKKKMCVVSGGSKNNVMNSLKGTNLLNLFSFVITSNDGYAPKPSPDAFLEAAHRLELSPNECIVFEDGDYGIKAAKIAGMQCIDIRNYLDD